MNRRPKITEQSRMLVSDFVVENTVHMLALMKDTILSVL
jgi:hypothetical protein